jgi:hypothetical protein
LYCPSKWRAWYMGRICSFSGLPFLEERVEWATSFPCWLVLVFHAFKCLVMGQRSTMEMQKYELW